LAPKRRPITAAMLNSKKRKRMGSGDTSGLQNRRELASLALVSSTLTRFRQFFITTLVSCSPFYKLLCHQTLEERAWLRRPWFCFPAGTGNLFGNFASTLT